MNENSIIEINTESDLPDSLQDVFSFWNSLPKQDKGPLASSFALENIPYQILPWSVLVDVIHDPLDYRFRFWGTERVNLIGEELTGKLLSQISDKFMRVGNEIEYNYVFDNGLAVLCKTPFTTSAGLSSQKLSIRLPLTNEDGKVSMIYSAMDPNSVTDVDYQYFGTSPKKAF